MSVLTICTIFILRPTESIHRFILRSRSSPAFSNPVRLTSKGYNLGWFPCITMTCSVTPDLRYIGKPNKKIWLFSHYRNINKFFWKSFSENILAKIDKNVKIVHQIRDNDCVNIRFIFFPRWMPPSIRYNRILVHLVHLVATVNNILLKSFIRLLSNFKDKLCVHRDCWYGIT